MATTKIKKADELEETEKDTDARFLKTYIKASNFATLVTQINYDDFKINLFAKTALTDCPDEIRKLRLKVEEEWEE